MNILIDIRLLGRGGLTGVEEYTYQVVDHILKLDSKNSYQLFYNSLREQPVPTHWARQTNVALINWRISNRLLDLTTRTTGWPKINKLTRSDLIFSPHFNILNASVPRLLTFHDLSFIHHPYFFRWHQKLWNWLQDYKNQARRASKIIADSEFTKSDIINLLGIPEEKITVIYPGVNSEFKKLEGGDKNLKQFKAQHNLIFPFLLYLGTLEPRKNIPAVMRAFSALKADPNFKDLRLIIAGRPGWLYRSILKEAGASPAQGEIIFWGPVENRERIFLYNLAEAFVYPSFFEGFGFPPLEAQACGCPVIVANRTSLPEIMDNSALLVDPWRLDDLTSALRKILTERGLRLKLANAGYKNSKRFNWQKTAQTMLKLFHDE